MKSTTFLYHALMIKYTSKTMISDPALSKIWHLVMRVKIIKNSYSENYSKQLFCQSIKILF